MNLVLSLIASLCIHSCLANNSDGTLIKHILQLNPHHPICTTPDHCTTLISSFFDALPAQLMSCQVSCSEFADPRMSYLCKYMAVKAPGHPGLLADFKFKAASKELEECVGGQPSFPIPLYSVVDACSTQLYSREDALIASMYEHVKKSGDKGAVEFMDGLVTLIRDLRPMSLTKRVLVGACFLGSVLVIAFCFYQFVFGGDYKPPSDQQQEHQ
jgi:hypothetical protein